MKIRVLLVILTALMSSVSCTKEKKSAKDYQTGELTISTDDAFKSVTEALAEAYIINYPESKVKVRVTKEDLGFIDLLKGKVRLAVMSRELNSKEIAEYKRVTELDYVPSPFAVDAVVFVVPANSARTSITLDEIKSELHSPSSNLIFDGTNSGNLNFLAQKIGKQPGKLKFSVINGNENVVRELGKYPDKVGVISLNTLSRPYDEHAKQLRSMVKILPVAIGEEQFAPDLANIKTMKYPFTRVVYFLVNEGNFQIASGVMRFAGTQLGQMVVDKEGLQPYNIYKREVQMR